MADADVEREKTGLEAVSSPGWKPPFRFFRVFQALGINVPRNAESGISGFTAPASVSSVLQPS